MELKDILEAAGPTASLVFAAWIFLSSLQTRYTRAYDRYRSLIREYRENGTHSQRKQNLADLLLYKRRCQQMRLTVTIDVVAAILLISALIAGALKVILPDMAFLKYIGAFGVIAGLCLVIVATIPVIIENVLIQHAIESELSDMHDLSEAAGQPATFRDEYVKR